RRARRRKPGYVVIEAPAPSTSANAQSVASLADIALVAVELKRARYADVTDAAEQLRRVGTPLLGAVGLPRLVPHRDEPPPPPINPPDDDEIGLDDLLEADVEEEYADEAASVGTARANTDTV